MAEKGIAFEYFNQKTIKNSAEKINKTIGKITPPNGQGFGVESALTNLEQVDTTITQSGTAVKVHTLGLTIPTEESVADAILDAKVDLLDDVNAADSELQTQITSQADRITQLNETKLNKNQGSINSGKILFVDNNGDVVPASSTEMGGLIAVAHDQSLEGAGTDTDPLRVSDSLLEEIETTQNNLSDLGDQVQGIEEKIPGEASPTNQLADKDFVENIKNDIEQNISDGLAQKQDKATAINYDNIANCITEIPQDIKLELNNGTLTLKAGSKIYVPNGSGVFNELIIQNDLTATSGGDSPTMCLVKADGTGIVLENETECVSGSTDPLSGTAYHTWYDTANNRIKRYGANGNYVYDVALPVASVARTSTEITSIHQMFNGFGYIGSTVFALPGVKGLIPNGRNADGSLNNIEITTPTIQTMIMESYMASRKGALLTLSKNSELGGMGVNQNSWGTVKRLSDIVRPSYYACYYCLEDNLVHYFDGSGIESISQRAFISSFDVDSNNKIISFTPKTAFHAVDYNDTEYMAHQAMPCSKYIDLTLGASGTQYTAPADGYIRCVLSTTINGYLSMYNNYWQNGSTDGAYVGGMIPIRAGATVGIYYEGLLQVVEFRFVYAVGAQ